jgi:hypothetical protein
VCGTFLVDVMYCQPPKSKFTLAMERLELKFRIESKPVVLLIIILITNTALYVALIPFLVSQIKKKDDLVVHDNIIIVS